MSTTLLAVLVVATIAVHLVVAWFVVRRDRNPLELLGGAAWETTDAAAEMGPPTDSEAVQATPDGSPPPLESDGDVVVCRHCGAENRPDYRYCRWCVRTGLFDDGGDASGEPTPAQRPL